MLGLFGGAAGQMAGGMSRNLGRDPKVQRRAGLFQEPERSERPRGLFGGAANFLQNERGGVSNLDRIRLAAAYMRDDPSFAMAAERGIADQRAMYDRRQEIEQERRNQASQIKLEGVQDQQARQQEIQRLYALEDQYGLDRGALSMLPEDARSGVISELAARQLTPEAPDAPTTRTVNRGGEVVTEEWAGQGWQEVGRGPRSTGVTVNTGSPGPQLDPFQESMAEAEAEQFSGYIERGPQANRNLRRIDELEALLAESGSGLGTSAQVFAGRFGIEIGEGVGAAQAAEALINSMVPEQRPPGSGVMSDADLRLFQRSLPQLINTSEGNRIIIETMRAINQYDAALAEIGQQAASGVLTREQARERVNALNNPIDPLRRLMGQGEERQQRPRMSDFDDMNEYLDAVDEWMNGGG